MTTQSPSEYVIYLVINISELHKIKKVLNNNYKNISDISLEYYEKKSMITVIGKNTIKIAKNVYEFIDKTKTDILTQTITDSNISIIIDDNKSDFVMTSLHNNFFNQSNKLKNTKYI